MYDLLLGLAAAFHFPPPLDVQPELEVEEKNEGRRRLGPEPP
jgi:hypothetical protein